jgi:hypothetical protein
MNSFRIPDPAPCFGEIFLTLSSESLLCYLYETGLPLKLSPETLFLFKTLDPRSGMKKFSDPDPGSGIKHPGSATLLDSVGNTGTVIS